MGDAPPVIVPTAVFEPFDFGDEPFGDHDAIASVLDDPGRMLGVERDAGRASKAAPAVFDRASRSEYAAPSAAAAAAAKAVADELEALAEGFPAEESLGVQIGTIGGSRAAAAATAALATDAKAARRADQLKKYGRGGGSSEPGTGAAKKNVRLPRSIYARDLESHARAKAEREAREARARAPFVTARYGVKLPAPVTSVQIGEKSAKARARRAALLAANQAKQMRLRPESAGPLRSFPGNAPGPWRVNANVAHDVTDPVSVAFNDAKRARAKAALRAKEEREKRDPMGLRAPRVDRSKYPSFKAWLDAQAAHDARLRAQMPGYADAARAANAKRREAAYVAKARAASGVPNAPGERKMIVGDDVAGDARTSVPTSPDPAPALNRFIALTEAFADASSGASASALSAEDQEKALMECAAEAAREAVEAAAAAASRASLVADRRDEDEVAAAAARVGEAAYEDEALLRQVAEVRTPTKASTEPFILGQNPRGSPRALFGASAFGSASAETEPDPKPVAGEPLAAEKTREERLADALSAMTPEERLAARAKASKGWSGDFTGVFYAKNKTTEGEDASASAAPTWSEKPKSPNEKARGGGGSRDVRGDDDDDDAKVDTDALAVQFIGPNAAELAFRALNPDVPKEATEKFDENGSKRNKAYASPGATAAAAAAARAAEGLDPSDPNSVAQCKARLAEMGIEFFGKQADAMAFQAVFPEHDVPKDPDAKDAETPAENPKPAFDPAVPLAHQTGAAGLAVEFIGANAEELTRRALGGDDANGDDAGLEAHAVWSSDREAEALASALPSTPDAKPSPVEKLETETPLETATPPDVAVAEDAALSAAQEEAWAKAEVAVPGTSAAPTTLEANLEDARTAAGDVAAAEAAAAIAAERNDRDDDEEAFSAQTDAAFAEAERASAIDAGSGAAVPTALVAPLAEDALRDAGAPGGGEL